MDPNNQQIPRVPVPPVAPVVDPLADPLAVPQPEPVPAQEQQVPDQPPPPFDANFNPNNFWNAVGALANGQANFQAALNNLGQQMAAFLNVQANQPQPQPHRRPVPTNPLTVFKGKPSDVNRFVNDCRDYFQLNRAHFETDNDRILWMSTFLHEGPPKAWFTALR